MYDNFSFVYYSLEKILSKQWFLMSEIAFKISDPKSKL
jgi:hypothetical protein